MSFGVAADHLSSVALRSDRPRGRAGVGGLRRVMLASDRRVEVGLGRAVLSTGTHGDHERATLAAIDRCIPRY